MRNGMERERILEFRENGSAIHITADPEPLLVDPKGEELTAKKGGLMGRIDTAGSEQVTLRKSTLWFIATGFVLMQVIFSYGGSLLGWTRDDQSVRNDMSSVKEDVKELKEQIGKLSDDLMTQRIKDAEKRGYELGAVDGKTGHADSKK